LRIFPTSKNAPITATHDVIFVARSRAPGLGGSIIETSPVALSIVDQAGSAVLSTSTTNFGRAVGSMIALTLYGINPGLSDTNSLTFRSGGE